MRYICILTETKPEGVSLKELAASLALTSGAASAMVEMFVRRELLERRTDQQDRRAVRIRLSESGRRLIRELGRTHTVILSSHILSEVKAVCDKALILSQGHLAAVVDLAAEERDLEELFLELTAPEETSDKKED